MRCRLPEGSMRKRSCSGGIFFWGGGGGGVGGSDGGGGGEGGETNTDEFNNLDALRIGKILMSTPPSPHP